MNCFKVIIFIWLGSICFCSCRVDQKEIIDEKNECYSKKLATIKNDPLYSQVMSDFQDTFEVMKYQKEYFGVPERVQNVLDSAIFFSSDKRKCVLIVLQRNDAQLAFGRTRTITGSRVGKKWVFRPNMDISFDKNYLEAYTDNNIKNLSTLARYSVLSMGNPSQNGCDIDEQFWFLAMQK